MTDTELSEAFFKEMTAMEKENRVMSIPIPSVVAFTIIAQLQLALRHPGNKDRMTAITIAFIKTIAALHFHDKPACMEVIRQGFDTKYDQ